MERDAQRADAVRKRIEFDGETYQALVLLARDSMRSLQELSDEAFRDLLRKHNRPVSLREALKASARQTPANDPLPHKPPTPPRKRGPRSTKRR